MVDLATLALELNTTGLARGEREVTTILSRLSNQIEQFVQKTSRLGESLTKASRVRRVPTRVGKPLIAENGTLLSRKRTPCPVALPNCSMKATSYS